MKGRKMVYKSCYVEKEMTDQKNKTGWLGTTEQPKWKIMKFCSISLRVDDLFKEFSIP